MLFPLYVDNLEQGEDSLCASSINAAVLLWMKGGYAAQRTVSVGAAATVGTRLVKPCMLNRRMG